MSDSIAQLPTIDRPLTPAEADLVALTKSARTSKFVKLAEALKTPLVAGALFMALSCEWMDAFLKNNVAYARASPVSLLAFKTVVFVCILFVVLARSGT